ncbi:ubiquinone biosynthesis O-methyltransferase [Thermoflavifilum aggregans]|uniref:Ubiquinone biosynthesis O-methyltransferase n=1 Tax=Thermoflavifilum aggregans TaxID=454188 RepID=A0A2M9CXE8_9BACT|nr:class I SAM-dependent methyltransferase [Thermoflavifilum aggregans]PJJ76584.1 ubiquinone biosynthesis O-methyltransferase [Thermoflavifilum aggregans]
MNALSTQLSPSYILPEKYEYDRIVDVKRLHFIRQQVEHLPIYSTILDIGCGNGVISRYLGGMGFRVLGVDISEKAIDQARKLNMWEHVRFEVMHAEKLTMEGAQFDVIICSEVLEHLDHPEVLLQQINKLLKENGKLIVTVPNGYGPRELLVTRPTLYIRNQQPMLWNYLLKVKKIMGYRGTTVQSAADRLDHVQFFTRRQLKNLAKSQGFVITRWSKSNFMEDVFPFSFFTKRIPFLQRLDCELADMLPYFCTGGFLMVWEKRE